MLDPIIEAVERAEAYIRKHSQCADSELIKHLNCRLPEYNEVTQLLIRRGEAFCCEISNKIWYHLPSKIDYMCSLISSEDIPSELDNVYGLCEGTICGLIGCSQYVFDDLIYPLLMSGRRLKYLRVKGNRYWMTSEQSLKIGWGSISVKEENNV